MWRELITSLHPDAKFNEPASPDGIQTLEHALGVALPPELRALLIESNGVQGEYSLDLIWPTDRIMQDNLRFRTSVDFKDIYMPFDPLLFFADAGNGDQFAFVILDNLVRSHNIFAWNHEDDSRTWVAPSLDRYLEWVANGTISL
jgi:hypothetical protein